MVRLGRRRISGASGESEAVLRGGAGVAGESVGRRWRE